MSSTYTTPVGHTYRLYTKEEANLYVAWKAAKTGLGTFFVIENNGHCQWGYETPSGRRIPTYIGLERSEEAPPLPKPKPVKQSCYCGPHVCNDCGTPYFKEVHGTNYGACTYCYAAG